MNTKKNSKNKIKKIDFSGQKKLRIFLSIGLVVLILLIIRIAVLQFVQGSSLKEQAVKNQLTSKLLTANRGAIYDATGKALAISADVDTISINPSKLKYKDGSVVDKEVLAKAFSDIFSLDYDETLNKISTKTSSFKIVEKVEQEKINTLEAWIKDNKITSGITIEPDIKRYYPYNNLASSLIGFTGTDNNGLVGLENSLNDMLAGTSRKTCFFNRFCQIRNS